MSTTFYKSIVTQQCSADNATYLSSQFKYSVAVSNTKDPEESIFDERFN